MADGFRIEPDRLTESAAGFAGIGDDLVAALDRLTSTLDGLDGMIGDDKPGRAFAAHYRPDAHATRAAGEHGGAILRGMTDGGVSMADNHAAKDAENAKRLSS
jgi:hypothetical protein